MSYLLRQDEVFKAQEINILLNSGGLGDNIARLPALLYLEKHYPHITANLYGPDYFLELGREVLSRTRVQSKERLEGFKDLPSYWFDQASFISSLGHHLVDLGFSTFLNRSDIPIEEKNYPKLKRRDLSFNLPHEFVVLTPGFTAKAREMPDLTLNRIIDGVIARRLWPVFLGKKQRVGTSESFFNEGVNYTYGIDLRDKTSLLEAAEVIARAKAIVGLDNGLIHLAGMTETPIVVGYSSQVPMLRAPIRNNQIGHNCYYVLPDTCTGCEAKVRFDYKHDFRECFFGDRRCLDELTAEKYLKGLDEVLG